MRKKIGVGSLNKTKVAAIEAVFPDDKVLSIAAASDVAAQPTSNEMTRLGALNRARYGMQMDKDDFHYSIGLEGGVSLLEGELYLCNWGALVTSKGATYTASAGLLPLPASFIEPILSGVELSTLMAEYTNRHDIGSQEGAIGIFTAGEVTRLDMYTYLGKLLRGQLKHDVN